MSLSWNSENYGSRDFAIAWGYGDMATRWWMRCLTLPRDGKSFKFIALGHILYFGVMNERFDVLYVVPGG